MEILCFFAGIAFIYTKASYSFIFFSINFFLKPHWTLIICFFAGISWSLIHNGLIAEKGMPKGSHSIPKVSLEGEIISIPNSDFSKTQFQFLAKRLNNHPVKSLILLSCYTHCPPFKVGDLWQFEAKIKKPTNLRNPGNFDFVSWLSARHIQWTGYIKPQSAKLVHRPIRARTLLGLRESFAQNIANLLPDENVLGVFEALTLGLTSHITQSQWELFRHTGTTHLMVISGAHIGLVATLVFWLIRWLWSRSERLCLYYPAQQAAGLVSLVAAFAYALIAGFAPSAQRALFACFFMLLKNFLNFRFTHWQAWRYSLFLVLILEPHDVLSPGFYLSFLAVASLFLGNQRFFVKGFRKTLCLQLVCLFALMPLTLFWFSYGAVNGFIANIFAIPLVEFIIVPLALILLILTQYWNESLLLLPVVWVIKLLLFFLKWVDSLSLFNLSFSFNWILIPISLMLSLFFLVFLPIKSFLLATLLLFITAFFSGNPRVKEGSLEVNVLDVGQGLAIVVRTANHLLIYDTGIKFFQGKDMAQLAIIPFLKTLGIKQIDKLIISHPDLDHRGGFESLEKTYPIGELLVNDVAFYHRGKNCHHYQNWRWDGVAFQFFAIHKPFKDKNNKSCVLQIENRGLRILFTGDIEKLAEDYLIQNYQDKLLSDILIVPHHGSKTSSSQDFIQHIAPKFAIISAGIDNRYHFPHAETLATFKRNQVKIINTADHGMVQISMGKEGIRLQA